MIQNLPDMWQTILPDIWQTIYRISGKPFYRTSGKGNWIIARISDAKKDGYPASYISSTTLT